MDWYKAVLLTFGENHHDTTSAAVLSFQGIFLMLSSMSQMAVISQILRVTSLDLPMSITETTAALLQYIVTRLSRKHSAHNRSVFNTFQDEL